MFNEVFIEKVLLGGGESPSIKLNKSSAFTSFDSFGIILTDTKFILNFKNIYQIFYSDNVITMH